MLQQNKIRIAEHIEVIWAADECDAATCPNCGAAALAPRLLDIDYRPPGKDYRFTVNICRHCGARFFDGASAMDYSTNELIEIGWHAYQIQVGAGLWPIAAPLSRIAKPAGARLLEIGGAYGFGLDFGIRACAWEGEGYDPSPLAAFGANALGLNLKQDYFEDKDLRHGPYDIVLATEVIEHLPDPPAFFALIYRALAQDGILLVTTPDGEKITPGLGSGALLPMLSPGAHLVLQTAASLLLALQNAGFQHVEIERNGLSLIAYASPVPFTLHGNPGKSRELYRSYLVQRARCAAPGSDLLFGFAGRGLFEAVNDGDFAAAEAAWQMLLPATRRRFGIDLESITALPAGAGNASLAELILLMPLGLGMILYSRAISQLLQGVARDELLPLFRLALAALDALQAALAKRSLTDGLAAELRIAAEAEITLCLAEAADPDCIPALLRLLRRDSTHITTAWRSFIMLVNGARFAEARQLQQAAGLFAPDDSLALNLRQDALFTTGVLALQQAADWPRAAAIFAQLRRLLLQPVGQAEAPHHLFWPALRGETVALHRLDRADDALALLRQCIPVYAGAPDDLIRQLAD